MIKKNLFLIFVLLKNSKNNSVPLNQAQHAISRLPQTEAGYTATAIRYEELMNNEIRHSTFFRIFTWSEILIVLGICITAFITFFSNTLTASFVGLMLNLLSALGLTCASIMHCTLETSCTFIFSLVIFLYSLLIGLFELAGQHFNISALEDISGTGVQTTVGLIESILNIIGAVLLLLKMVIYIFLVRRNSELVRL
jgi:hypothetical protein